MEMVIQLFLNLGFLISWKKSELTPSQNFLFLGEHYKTDQTGSHEDKTVVTECGDALAEPLSRVS
jgi:hypothetical protein